MSENLRGEVGTSLLFYSTFKAQVAAAEMIPFGTELATKSLAARHAPKGRVAVGIGQEALVLINRDNPRKVEKLFPTTSEHVVPRRNMLYTGYLALKATYGDIVLDTETTVEPTPGWWLRRLGAKTVPTQHQKYLGSDLVNLSWFMHHRNSDDFPELASDIESFAEGTINMIEDNNEMFIPDIQGRGKNLIVVEDNKVSRLKLIDVSGFHKEGPYHLISESALGNTQKIVYEMEDWVS